MKPKIHIGLSAFSNGYWKGIFYPEEMPRNQWFGFYTGHFDTYEINKSFYNFPTVKGLKSWYDKTPDGFTFSLKMHRSVTHFKRFIDVGEAIEKFYANAADGLGDKLACILFQLPPSFDFSTERLDQILSAVDPAFKNVVEFRNETWWRQEVFDALSERNIIFCNVSYPKLPETIVRTSDIGYVRLHGTPKLFYSGYPEDYLEHLSNDLKASGFREVYVYFNNTASAAGITDALAMKSKIKVK